MGWAPINQEIEALRSNLAQNPTQVLNAIQTLLENYRYQKNKKPALRPSDKLRLLGLAVSAYRKLGDLESAELTAQQASLIHTKSPTANADFLLYLAYLRISQERPSDATRAAKTAARLLQTELDKPKPTAKESLRRRRWVQAALGAAHITLGEVFLHLDYGTPKEAFAHALRALQLTANLVKAPTYTRRAHLSAITLLCPLLARYEQDPITQQEALQLIKETEHTLIYRIQMPPNHIHRIKLRWAQALILASTNVDRAEAILVNTIETLLSQGWKDDAQRALDDLTAIIKKTIRPARAGYYQTKYAPAIR